MLRKNCQGPLLFEGELQEPTMPSVRCVVYGNSCERILMPHFTVFHTQTFISPKQKRTEEKKRTFYIPSD